jgi:hypothetical protein
MTRKLNEQKNLIGSQDQKIKELSKCVVENYHIKNLLDNMEDKIHSFKSVGSKEVSISG